MSVVPHPADTGKLPSFVINRALQEAGASPCRKSKRGCAIFVQNKNGAVRVVGQGRNSPPAGFDCERDAACRATCGKRCIHAEVDAVLDMLKLRAIKPGDSTPELVHVKLNDKEHIVAGGPPSCWPCANLIVHSLVAAVWLFEDMHEGPRWTRWPATAFLHSTLKRQPDHPDYQPRPGIECPCESIGCRAQDGAKRNARGAWCCVKCGHPAAP